jgi:prevent-host-death family protein
MRLVGSTNRRYSRTREVQASEAKIHLLQLLDEVERGETIIITRHGRGIARIVPEASQRQQEINNAIDDITELAKQSRKLTVAEILSLIGEGRKH